MDSVMLSDPLWEALILETRQAYDKGSRLRFNPRYDLAGGTGLALQISHRFSVHLDFVAHTFEALVDHVLGVVQELFDELSQGAELAGDEGLIVDDVIGSEGEDNRGYVL